jgi:hypothetical protein
MLAVPSPLLSSLSYSFTPCNAIQEISKLVYLKKTFFLSILSKNKLTSVLGSIVALSRAFLHSIAGVSNNTAAYYLGATNRSSKCSISGLF